MDIATRLKFAALVEVAVVAVIVVVLWSTTQRVQQEFAEDESARDIFDAVIGVRYLTFEYVMLRQERTRVQWQLQHASLSKLLANTAKFTSATEQAALAELRRTNTSIDALFNELVASRQLGESESNRAGIVVLEEFETRVVGKIMTRAQDMLSEARSLSEQSQADVLAAERLANIAVTGLGAIIVLVVAGTLILVLRSVIRPLAKLGDDMAIVGAGNLSFRLNATGTDEFGKLARAFDAMTARLSETTVSRDELLSANEVLQAEIGVRQQAERKVQAQLANLNLLHQITRAIGERQDLKSIFQVVIRSLEEQLPVDFCCVGVYDRPRNTLVVSNVGLRSEMLARELAMTEHSRIDIDANGLSRCVRGQLVYEPDASQIPFPFPQRLVRGDLGSFVLAPIVVEEQVFGVLIAARRQANAFSSSECEFLLQLSEHVALASHQAQIFAALQRAYDDLRQTQEAVLQQERLRVLGQMASGIAHDVNNAISPVALYTESLLESEPNLSERTRRYLEIIQRAIEDVAQTVVRMREFYREREPRLTLLAPLQLNSLVQQVIDLTHARWSDMPQERGVVIRMLTEQQTDLPSIMGVESEIREALTNLIFNAVDAMPSGGTLTLRTGLVEEARSTVGGQLARRAFVEVADTGVGMDEATRQRCLEPFFTTKGERGTGLGLATVYGVVQRHGADLEIDSAPGHGATIRLSFPVPAANEIEAVLPEPGLVPSSSLHILLVDDDPILLRSLQDTLQADRHRVICASGGQAGIEIFRAARTSGDPFAVVVSDLGMPHVDGRRVAAAVKEISPDTPVILLTGWGHRLISEGDRPAQVDRVLAKPPKLRELREALAHLCKSA
jgi:signal transduction histidine kinase/ActR/RegA family two-component response regulator/HAMP domain-containing protein